MSTDSHEGDPARQERRAAHMAELRARMAASDDTGTDRPDEEVRRARFVGAPPGFNEDGTRQRTRTAAERQHKRDILAGRKAPGSPIEDPAD